jgi:hypothetical protein
LVVVPTTEKEGKGWQKTNTREKGYFFPNFGLLFPYVQCLEFTSIYREWKRNFLFLLRTNIGPWFKRKDPNCWIKGVIMTCKNSCRKASWVGQLEATSWRM